MREFKHGVGVIALQKLLNLLLFKMFEKSLTKVDFRSKNQKDMSGDAVIAVNQKAIHTKNETRYLALMVIMKVV